MDGQTEAVIVWRGVDGLGDQGPWARTYRTQREAMQAVGSIDAYTNVTLVSATIRPRGTS